MNGLAYNQEFLKCINEVMRAKHTVPVLNSSELKNLEQIGQGTSARVFKAVWFHETVAVKKLRNSVQDSMSTMVHEMAEEINLLSQLSSPNIVRFYGTTEELGIVMEFMVYGTLTNVVQNPPQRNGRPLTTMDYVRLTLHAGCGMAYLHSCAVVHRDLNPNNIMVTDECGGLVAKLADFGLSRITAVANRDGERGSSMGTPTYAAPEVLDGKEPTVKSDVYSFGVTLWYAVAHRDPFSQAKGRFDLRMVVAEQKQRPPMLEDTDLQGIVSSCWAHDPGLRPTAIQVTARLKEYLNQRARAQRWA